jgi:dienelactone hydrolase
MLDLNKISSLVKWPVTRKELEELFYDALSYKDCPAPELAIRLHEEQEVHGVTRRQIVFNMTETELVTAWVFIPEGREEVPAILCCHHESLSGKDEAAGLDDNLRLAFAQHYAENGYITLAIDIPTVNKRQNGKNEPYDTVPFYKANKKSSFAGKMLCDHKRALDVLCEIKRVDATRIGVIGHGLGGFNALILAAVDDRIQACVSSCGFTRFTGDRFAGGWAGLESLVLLPKIQKCKDEDYPFDWEHILALAAPTPVQVITTSSNALHDKPKSCQKAVAGASKIYKLLGASDALDHFTHHDGHTVAPETIEIADEWFERWL